MPPRALGASTIAVLKALASARYGLDIMTITGLPSGTVYPTLSRMETRGYVRGVWEPTGTAEREGRPRRRYYVDASRTARAGRSPAGIDRPRPHAETARGQTPMTPRLIVAAAARLVPSALRAEWREEWLAELWHLRQSGATYSQLIAFAAGAFGHAWAERSRRHAPSAVGDRPHWTTGALADLFDGIRSVRRAPVFVAMTVGTLGIGMAANVAVWSVVNGVLLEPPPYPDAERVVRLGWDFDGRWLTVPAKPPYKAEYLRANARAFDAVTTWSERTMDVGPSDLPQRRIRVVMSWGSPFIRPIGGADGAAAIDIIEQCSRDHQIRSEAGTLDAPL